ATWGGGEGGKRRGARMGGGAGDGEEKRAAGGAGGGVLELGHRVVDGDEEVLATSGMSVQALQAELLSQLRQLKRATTKYKEKTSQLNREQGRYESLMKSFEEQAMRSQELEREQAMWKNDVERKKEELRNLKLELERVQSQWRKARIAELRNEELKENNLHLERLLVISVSVPIALLAEKSLRSKL
ncbi:Uncharacterized protein SCF082_LOCUS19978, partial [Durusdinium trenchii]